MTRQQLLVQQSAEEAIEVAHRCLKAVRFSLGEIQPGQPLTNHNRILQEFTDLCTVMEMAGLIRFEHGYFVRLDEYQVLEKRGKVEHYLQRSRQFGVLTTFDDPDAV